MKKLIFAIVTLLFFNFSYAQREGGFRVGLDVGYIPASGGGGVAFDIEPKYNIKENMNVGLRIGIAAIARDIEDVGNTTFVTATAVGSYIGTFDYYFPSGKSFVPFVGGGLGYSTALSVRADEDANVDGLDPDSGFGGLIRGGFEWGKFRMNLEYNIVPKTPLYLNGPLTTEDISNSYFAVNLGFYIGGGKWKKN